MPRLTKEQREKLRRFSKVTNLIVDYVTSRELQRFAEGVNNRVANYYHQFGFRDLDRVRDNFNLGTVDGLLRNN